MIKDTILIIALLVLIAACFYAFQLVVLLIVGYIVYLCLPMVRAGNTHIRKGKRWK